MIVKNWQLFAAVAFLSSLFSCQSEAPRQVPDVSHIEADTPIRRFEQSLFQLDTAQMEKSLESLTAAYPELAPIYLYQLLGADQPQVAPDGPGPYLKGFLSHEPLQALYDTIQLRYADFSPYKASFDEAFRYFQHYFPEEPLPTVTTLVSEFAIAAFVYGENDLAVSLDYFLGPTYPYQQLNPNDPAFSSYLARTFTPEHLVSKTVQALINGLAAPPREQRLLDLMLMNGRKLYVLDQLLPYTPDSIKLEITGAQTEWLSANELEMWAYLLKEDLIYDTDWQRIRKLVDYSPHSPGMPPEAPGRTANWLGWQIVKAYMKRHPETTLPELLGMTDAQALLDASRYKPER